MTGSLAATLGAELTGVSLASPPDHCCCFNPSVLQGPEPPAAPGLSTPRSLPFARACLANSFPLPVSTLSTRRPVCCAVAGIWRTVSGTVGDSWAASEGLPSTHRTADSPCAVLSGPELQAGSRHRSMDLSSKIKAGPITSFPKRLFHFTEAHAGLLLQKSRRYTTFRASVRAPVGQQNKNDSNSRPGPLQGLQKHLLQLLNPPVQPR